MPGLCPRVGEIDVHERRAPAEADLALEAATLVDAGVGVEDRVQRLDHLVWVLVEKSTLTSRVRIFDAVDGEALVEFSGPPGLATCPIEIGASVDHCASVLAASHRLVLSYLTSPHQY